MTACSLDWLLNADHRHPQSLGHHAHHLDRAHHHHHHHHLVVA
jgi:hypothetical protein